jgi:hypothetical protein
MMQGMAAETLGSLAYDAEDAVTIASAGAIPLLVQLLKPGPRADVRKVAAGALCNLAANSDNAASIATAGAILPLAQLARSDADDDTKAVAAKALEAIRKGVAENRAAAAVAAKSSASMVQAMERLGVDSRSDVQI